MRDQEHLKLPLSLRTTDAYRLTSQRMALFEIMRQLICCRTVVLAWLQNQSLFPIHVPSSGLAFANDSAGNCMKLKWLNLISVMENKFQGTS